MNSEQKYKLARWSITLACICVTVIVVFWITLAHKPSRLKSSASIKSSEVTIECDFTEKE